MNIFENRDILAHSIVFIGDFNPPIFHPSWLSKYKIISSAEEESSVVKLVHKDISAFQTEWMDFQITRERFKVSTTNEALFTVLKDTVVMIFNVLKHTPIRQMGINFDGHFRVLEETVLTKFFDRIAPAAIWKTVFDEPEFANIIITQNRKGGREGFTGIRIQPSTRVEGVMFGLNEHFEFKDSIKSSIEPLKVLESEWNEASKKFKVVVNQLWEGQ